ncbi:1-deoxy-D-xylulose-5-phosphate reductoisomerase [uncultured Ilyobacter sp.]|uniref:1-deoxy-D-xylulose-5-phosphate reductoisomerase n=1 Tax=uncultured Ilyobacter sp. TaxID=544433 RepID=UPI0029C90F36|nr:1-deoxy-D-xylulose-5-phosphate reductoisomerase [uncultured Ilyobacter sp.]
MKMITILGSTGSIGTNALEVIRNSKGKFKVLAMSAHNNHDLLLEQIEEFSPKYVSIGTEEGYKVIKDRYPDLLVYRGEEGLKILGGLEEADTVLTAVSGSVGIEATIEAVKKEKRIALANKETMVAAGELINKLLEEYKGAEIIPVDSEHSAIFQSMLGGRREEVKKIIITASGGTFRGKNLEELKNVTVEEALKHPNWSMGKKITIDSSTLVNKGLEVIEAHQLFRLPYESIEVLVHPQSIVHSMVEFRDTTVIAQLGAPDMKVPIQYAFTYPEREENISFGSLDFKKISQLNFEEPDHKVFKGIEYALEAGKVGKSMPTVFNAANEVAVDLFLKGKIKFLEIYMILREAIDRHTPVEIIDFETIKKVDLETRNWIRTNFG